MAPKRPACPVIQRRLTRGCQGGDVLAVQRAVYVALRERGSKGTNAKNGNYGEKTIKDLKTFQKLVGLNQSGEVGLNTLVALWEKHDRHPAGAFDDYGVQILYRTKLGKPTKIGDELEKGAKGPHVTALQRMLWRSLGADSQNSRNGGLRRTAQSGICGSFTAASTVLTGTPRAAGRMTGSRCGRSVMTGRRP